MLQRARPDSLRRRGPARHRGGARGIRQRQHRFDVRPAGAERSTWRAPTFARRRASARRTSRPISSPSSRTPCSGARRRALPEHDVCADMQISGGRCPGGQSVSSTMKSPPLPDPECAAGTTSTTGNSATTSASAPARTARSASPTASRATSAPSSRRCTCRRTAVEEPRHRPRPSCRSSSCSMRCAWSKGFQSDSSPSAPGLPFTTIAAGARKGEKQGLLVRDLKVIRPTERGQRFLNELLALFLPGETRARESGDRGAARAIRISSPAAK